MFPRSIRSLASAIAIATGSPHAIAQDCGPRWTGWGTVPGANGPINAAAILPDGRGAGRFLADFVGYRARPAATVVIAIAAFWGYALWRMARLDRAAAQGARHG